MNARSFEYNELDDSKERYLFQPEEEDPIPERL